MSVWGCSALLFIHNRKYASCSRKERFALIILLKNVFAVLKLSLSQTQPFKCRSTTAAKLGSPEIFFTVIAGKQTCTRNHSWRYVFQRRLLTRVSTRCQLAMFRHVKCFIRLDWDPNSRWLLLSLVSQGWGGGLPYGINYMPKPILLLKLIKWSCWYRLSRFFNECLDRWWPLDIFK